MNCRDTDLTERLDYSSAVAVLGYSLILSILRAFRVRTEAEKVMFSAPFLGFITTHILHLNNYSMDYGIESVLETSGSYYSLSYSMY